MPRPRKKKVTRKRRATVALSQPQLDYLEALRRVYPETRKWRDACALVKVVDPKTKQERPLSTRTVDAWRFRDGRPGRGGSPTFGLREKKLLDELDAMMDHVRYRTFHNHDKVEAPPPPPLPPLTDQQEVYLQTLRRTQDRMQACEAAGLTWQEIKAQQGTSTRFSQACEEIDEEFNVALQDLQRRKGLAGNVAAAEKALRHAEKKVPVKPPGSDADSRAERPKKAVELLSDMLLRYQPVRVIASEEPN